MFGHEVLALSLADAVFAGRGAAEFDRALDDGVRDRRARRAFVRVVEVHEHVVVDVAVARVPETQHVETVRRGLVLREPNHRRVVADGHGDVAGFDGSARRVVGDHRWCEVAAGLPEPLHRLARADLEPRRAAPFEHLAAGLDLGPDTVVRVEFEENQRRFGEIGTGVGVGDRGAQRVEEFDRGDVDPRLHRRRDRLGRGVEVVERRPSAADLFRLAGELERDPRHHTERALASDEEVGQIVAAGGLLRPTPGLDDGPVREHGFEPEHPVVDLAVLHGLRAAGVVRHHPADGRDVGGLRERREEEVVVVDRVVHRRPEHARLDVDLEVRGADVEHRVHPREVHAHAAMGRQRVAFEPRARRVGRHRNASPGGGREHRADFLGGAGPADRVGHDVLAGRCSPVGGVVATVVVAERDPVVREVVGQKRTLVSHASRPSAAGINLKGEVAGGHRSKRARTVLIPRATTAEDARARHPASSFGS